MTEIRKYGRQKYKGYQCCKTDNAVIFALSQVNLAYEKKSNRLPNLEHLKGSSSIEEKGDSVLFILLPHSIDVSADKNKTILNITKNGRGKAGNVSLTFDQILVNMMIILTIRY